MKYYQWFIPISQKMFSKICQDEPNKIKVSLKKLSKLFGSCSGVTECVSKAIGKKLWRSVWLLIVKRKHNWFIIERAFWNQRQNTQSVNLLQQSDIIDEVAEEPWLRNEMYILKKENLILKRKPLISSILYLKSMFSSFMMDLTIGFTAFAQMGVYKSVTVFVQV